MRRIFLGLLTGTGAAWFAWRLRGWPPAYWNSTGDEASADDQAVAPPRARLASVPRAEPARSPAEGVQPLPDLEELELAPLPEFSRKAAGARRSRPRGILASAERDSASQSALLTGRLALIADDDADIRTLAAQLLERAGFEVITAADGDEALRLAIDRDPAVCVLDWMMPRRSGLDVLESLRAGAQTRSTPVLLLTARAGNSDIERGLSAGADGYLTKPFTADQLRERVLELVELRAA